jgi:nitroimidazol reductase NimA-like FMN-containing flavoprotein (pyridoxamine 5'-phosphate oxidase superfamily)
MIGMLDSKAIDSLLEKQYFGRLGCHSNDFTYIVPISYAYDGSAIYCHCDQGKKVEVMRENPKVCFEVDSLENLASWQSVIAWGEYEEISEPAMREKALQILFNRKLPTVVSNTIKLCDDWPFHPGNLNDVPGIVFRINLTGKTGRFELYELPE